MYVLWNALSAPLLQFGRYCSIVQTLSLKYYYIRVATLTFRLHDVVAHLITLLLAALDLPDNIYDWFVSFLTGQQQKCIANGVCSSNLCITRGIKQGSGVGPTFYIVLKSDLRPLSPTNVLSKYAEDINLLVPQYCDVDMASEFDHVLCWAKRSKMVVNLSKTTEIVFRRPCPIRFHLAHSVPGIALVDHVRSLGIILQQGLSFDYHNLLPYSSNV